MKELCKKIGDSCHIMDRWLACISLLFFSISLLSCSSSENASQNSSNSNNKPSKHYTTAFPQRDISDELTQARESVLRIVSTSFYNSYTFDKPFLTLPDIKTNNPKDIATNYYSTEESTAGTAIVLQNTDRNVMLITCEHVVASPDTVITYYEGDTIPNNTFVKSISIKQKQNNLLFTNQELYSFNTIASDKQYDLAILTATLNSNDEKLPNRPLRFSAGNSKDLKMGSVLYILGYPRGYPMVTRGLASTAANRSSHYFITDALYNPGISGGLVLASKDRFRSLQWVGMARSASASTENILVPRPGEKYDQATKPYTDNPFVQQKTRISYGITQTIPIDTIKDFLEENEEKISRNGFHYSVSK